jgi:hypothetical protein
MANDTRRISQLTQTTVLNPTDRVLVLSNPNTTPNVQTISFSSFANAIVANAISIFPVANTTTYGIIKTDGVTTFVSNTGQLYNKLANSSTQGLVILGSTLGLDGNSALTVNTTAVQLKSTLAANVLVLTSNSTNYVGNVYYSNVVSNAQLVANLTNYVTNTALTTILTGYALSSTLSNYALQSTLANYTLPNGSYNWTAVQSHSANISIQGAVLSINTASGSVFINSTAVFLSNTTASQAVNVNSNIIVIGNSTVNASVNSTVYTGTANNASYLGTTAAASYQLNSTLNANVAAYLPTYAGVVNAASYTVGTAFTANSTLANTPAINVVNQTNTSTLYVTTSANVGTYFSVNSTSASKTVNASFTGANVYIAGTNTSISSNVTISANLTVTGTITGNTNGVAIGYRDVPQNFTNTSFTLAANDAGKHVLTQNSGSSTQTITVPNNASVAFTTGAAISIVVQSAGTVALANGASVTMYLAGNSTAKSTITLNSYSMATLLKIGTDTWMVSGTGAS